MKVEKLSLTRLFSRGKRSTEKHSERVKEIHIPATSFGRVPSLDRKEDSTDEILTETSQAACQRSGAGMTAFVP